MSPGYVWHDGNVVVISYFDGYAFSEGERYRHLSHKFIVDSEDSDPEMRYGYMHRDNEDANWVHVPKEMFPKEFLTTLLLMGVS